MQRHMILTSPVNVKHNNPPSLSNLQRPGPRDEQAAAELAEKEADLRAGGQPATPVAGWRGSRTQGQMQFPSAGKDPDAESLFPQAENQEQKMFSVAIRY